MQTPGPALNSLLVVGASARAAAVSIERAGLKPCAADMFCDSDLTTLCQCVRLSPYPHAAERHMSDFQADAWMFVGGLENQPDLVGTLAERMPLLGNSCEVLNNIRDPWRVARVLREHGISVPRILPPGHRPKTGDWICKPLRSCGGKRVFSWNSDTEGGTSKRTVALDDDSERVFQQRIIGRTVGAVFVADAVNSQLVGVTEQLTGTEWLGADGHIYSGSIGPLLMGGSMQRQLGDIGAALTSAFRLRGIFGVDAIWDGADIWPIEVNPRYTASVEVLERALDISIVRAHVQGCQYKLPSLKVPRRPRYVSGKAILYAQHDVLISSRLLDLIEAINSDGASSSIADIPHGGQRIAKGHPVVTLLADAADCPGVVRRLKRLAGSICAVLNNGII